MKIFEHIKKHLNLTNIAAIVIILGFFGLGIGVIKVETIQEPSFANPDRNLDYTLKRDLQRIFKECEEIAICYFVSAKEPLTFATEIKDFLEKEDYKIKKIEDYYSIPRGEDASCDYKSKNGIVNIGENK